MELLGQPVINGYFIAGSLVGPGGLGWVKELVQVQSVAQLGVSLLLFTLGLEFSLSKLRAVRGVALAGGLLEVVLMAILSGVFAKVIGGRPHEGIFTGLLVAMSSTSIVVKCLADSKTSNTSVGQITIGTLILQVCGCGWEGVGWGAEGEGVGGWGGRWGVEYMCVLLMKTYRYM